jgi:hypothetical protein
MTTINEYLLRHRLRNSTNPCISPDHCLDWSALRAQLIEDALGRPVTGLVHLPESRFETEQAYWSLAHNCYGDYAWVSEAKRGISSAQFSTALEQPAPLPMHGLVSIAFPATWNNLLILKNLIQSFDSESTIFPSASGSLLKQSLGIGARYTTLHWPAVAWTMAQLGLSLTANQNSIPRELVYDTDVMMNDQLDRVPFPFIGTDVPEGHQGQSVEGMSHGAVLSYLSYGFHKHRRAWGFNADHQPIGGKYDVREDRLVAGCLLASYITFDLSPELSSTPTTDDPAGWCAAHIPAEIMSTVRNRLTDLGMVVNEHESAAIMAAVWPAMCKMKARDEKYSAARAAAFSTDIGRYYIRELSIDEMPGITSPLTIALMLALCETLDVRVHYIAPAFGFQKNCPYPNQDELRRLVSAASTVCKAFDVSIGFHSGSGKSPSNYRLIGELTDHRLEIKTSGRYTYEMGVALSNSSDARDQTLWRAWFDFTRELAITSAFSRDETEQKMARHFIAQSLLREQRSTNVFANETSCRQALNELPRDPDAMFWFEYNFLFVLAPGGKPIKHALGNHSPAGYIQRARCYAISEEARLLFAQGVAGYIINLAKYTGLVDSNTCTDVRRRLINYSSYQQLLTDIAPQRALRLLSVHA